MINLKIIHNLYKKSRALSVLTEIGFGVVILLLSCYTVIITTSDNVVPNPIYVLAETLLTAEPIVVLIMLLSYEFFTKAKACLLEECLTVTPKGLRSIYYLQGAYMAVIAAVFTGILLLYNIAVCVFFYHVTTAEYLFNIAVSILVHVFLASLAGIAGSMLLVMFVKKITSYLIMIAVALINTPLIYTLEFRTNFPLSKIFCLWPGGIGFSAISQCGLALDFTKVIIFLLFFSVFGIIITIKFAHFRSKKTTACFLTASVVVGAASILLCIFPHSYINLDSQFCNSEFYLDYHQTASDGTYELQLKSDAAPKFSVTDYRMELDTFGFLRAKVDMTVDDMSLDSYVFTLYHRYKVSSVENANGEKLDFERDGDLLTVLPRGNMTESVTIRYSGADNVFFSYRNHLFLPGYFPYYPMAGGRELYDYKYFNFSPQSLENDAHFSVSIKGSENVYSNLEKNEAGEFCGEARSATFMCGMLKETDIDGFRIVYPYLDDAFDNFDVIHAKIEQAVQAGLDSNDINQIFIIPPMNFNSNAERTVLFPDHILTKSLMDFKNDYLKHIILPDKIEMYEAVYLCRERPNTFSRISEYPEEGGENICFRLKQAIDNRGEKYVLDACDVYLYDNSDIRTPSVFLKELVQT